MIGDVTKGVRRGERRRLVQNRLGNVGVKRFDAMKRGLVMVTKCVVKKLEGRGELETHAVGKEGGNGGRSK